MLTIGEWSIERDSNQWILTHTTDSVHPKTGLPTKRKTQSFHGTQMQCLKYLMDHDSQQATTVKELEDTWEKYTRQIEEALAKSPLPTPAKVRRRLKKDA